MTFALLSSPPHKMTQVCDAEPAAVATAAAASLFSAPPQLSSSSSAAGLTWQVLHGSPPLDASLPVALRPPAVPLSAFGSVPPPVVYTLAFWHIDDASYHDPSCGDWSALLLRGHDDSDRAPDIFLHRERFLHLRHASLDDVNVGIHATHACRYARRAWHHTALVVNRTSMVYYHNGELSDAAWLEPGNAFVWERGGPSSSTPLTASQAGPYCATAGRLRGVVWANEAASQADIQRVMAMHDDGRGVDGDS
jgi:hypothetical protein